MHLLGEEQTDMNAAYHLYMQFHGQFIAEVYSFFYSLEVLEQQY